MRLKNNLISSQRKQAQAYLVIAHIDYLEYVVYFAWSDKLLVLTVLKAELVNV
jgi:hypothetical protein